MSRYQIHLAILIMLLVGTTNYADASSASSGVAGALGAAAAKSIGKEKAQHCYTGPAITTKDGIKIGPTVVC